MWDWNDSSSWDFQNLNVPDPYLQEFGSLGSSWVYEDLVPDTGMGWWDYMMEEAARRAGETFGDSAQAVRDFGNQMDRFIGWYGSHGTDMNNDGVIDGQDAAIHLNMLAQQADEDFENDPRFSSFFASTLLPGYAAAVGSLTGLLRTP